VSPIPALMERWREVLRGLESGCPQIRGTFVSSATVLCAQRRGEEMPMVATPKPRQRAQHG